MSCSELTATDLALAWIERGGGSGALRDVADTCYKGSRRSMKADIWPAAGGSKLESMATT
jgi:hypothetical protein